MCKECGCGETNGNTRLQFTVKGYTEESAKEVEKALLGLPGVLFVHIHAHDGETTVDYSPAKTKLMDLLGVLQARNLEAALSSTGDLMERLPGCQVRWRGRRFLMEEYHA